MLAQFVNALWGWADNEPKDWSRAPYKRGHGRTSMLAQFVDALWGWADNEPKDWSRAPYKRGYADSSL
jgi:hypothetical protein